MRAGKWKSGFLIISTGGRKLELNTCISERERERERERDGNIFDNIIHVHTQPNMEY